MRLIRATDAPVAFSPLYQQIKALILQSLLALRMETRRSHSQRNGSWPTRYRVSQGTVRKAIDELAAENLVVRRQGKGTFVTTHALKTTPNTAFCG